MGVGFLEGLIFLHFYAEIPALPNLYIFTKLVHFLLRAAACWGGNEGGGKGPDGHMKVAEGRSCKRGVRGERNEVQSGNTQQGMVAPAAACSECQEGASIWRVYASIWRVRWRRRRHRARHREQIYFFGTRRLPPAARRLHTFTFRLYRHFCKRLHFYTSMVKTPNVYQKTPPSYERAKPRAQAG